MSRVNVLDRYRLYAVPKPQVTGTAVQKKKGKTGGLLIVTALNKL